MRLNNTFSRTFLLFLLFNYLQLGIQKSSFLNAQINPVEVFETNTNDVFTGKNGETIASLSKNGIATPIVYSSTLYQQNETSNPISKKTVDLTIRNLQLTTSTLANLKLNSKPAESSFAISAYVNFPDIKEDNTIIWEFHKPKTNGIYGDGSVILGLYVNKSGALYFKFYRKKAYIDRADITDGTNNNYTLPVYQSAWIDAPPGCGKKPNGNDYPLWYRVTCSFSKSATHIIISKPCETYYDVDGTLKGKNEKAQFPAQREGSAYNAGYAGNFGTVSEQYYWTGNRNSFKNALFTIGDKDCKQKSAMLLYKLEFYNQVLTKEQL